MSWSRALVVGILVALAVLLQSSLLARLPLPGGDPQLLVLLVSAVAWTYGPNAGMVTGFAGGVLADLTPPSDQPLGRSVLVLVVVGEIVGLLRRRPSGIGWPLFVVALATVVAGFGAAAVGAVLQQPQLPWGRLTGAVLAAAAYNVALAPFVLPLVGSGRRTGVSSRTLGPAPIRGLAPVRRRRRDPSVAGGSLDRSPAAGGAR